NIVYPRDTSYMTLSGIVQGFVPGSLGDGAMAMMIVKQKDKENQMYLVPINRNGTFDDPSVVLFDTAQIYYQFQDKSLEGATIQFFPNKLRVPPVGKNYADEIFPDTTGLARHLMLALEHSENVQKTKYKELEAVTVKARTKSSVELLD